MSGTPAEPATEAGKYMLSLFFEQTDFDWNSTQANNMRRDITAIERQARTAVPEIDVLRLIAAAKGVVAAQYGIHLGLSGSPEPKPEDFTPMVTQASIAELAAALAATAPQEPARDPLSPQWEDCKLCGGDHWTKDHKVAATAPQEPE